MTLQGMYLEPGLGDCVCLPGGWLRFIIRRAEVSVLSVAMVTGGDLKATL